MFRAVGNRCAVDLASLHLPCSDEDALKRLVSVGFKVIKVDLVGLARPLVGVARYRRGARVAEAPHVFDCSSLIKWLYAQRGVWLPRRTIQQIEMGCKIEPRDADAGDVIFTTGRINYYLDDPAKGVGHAGIMTGQGTVIHAANSQLGITECPVKNFLRQKEFRGIRRFLPNDRKIITFIAPPQRDVEWSDDFRWILLQRSI